MSIVEKKRIFPQLPNTFNNLRGIGKPGDKRRDYLKMSTKPRGLAESHLHCYEEHGLSALRMSPLHPVREVRTSKLYPA